MNYLNAVFWDYPRWTDVDPSHNPEFTMLEIYQAYVDYNAMMEYLEQVYEKACIAINGTTKVMQKYKGNDGVGYGT